MSIDSVASILLEKSDDITGDVLDLLLSMSDFGEFKDLMLSHKTGEVSALSGQVIQSHSVSQVESLAMTKAQ